MPHSRGAIALTRGVSHFVTTAGSAAARKCDVLVEALPASIAPDSRKVICWQEACARQTCEARRKLRKCSGARRSEFLCCGGSAIGGKSCPPPREAGWKSGASLLFHETPNLEEALIASSRGATGAKRLCEANPLTVLTQWPFEVTWLCTHLDMVSLLTCS